MGSEPQRELGVLGHSHSPPLGKAIRQLREKRSVTQGALAHSASITTATLGVIERGLSNPTWATIKSIGAALGVNVSALAKAAEKLEG